jgi:hypothetical protein
MAAHQSAVLRRDAAGQETLLVLLLRSYLADNLYDQVRAVKGAALGYTWWGQGVMPWTGLLVLGQYPMG